MDVFQCALLPLWGLYDSPAPPGCAHVGPFTHLWPSLSGGFPGTAGWCETGAPCHGPCAPARGAGRERPSRCAAFGNPSGADPCRWWRRTTASRGLVCACRCGGYRCCCCCCHCRWPGCCWWSLKGLCGSAERRRYCSLARASSQWTHTPCWRNPAKSIGIKSQSHSALILFESTETNLFLIALTHHESERLRLWFINQRTLFWFISC